MDHLDEYRMALAYQHVNGFPTMPDRVGLTGPTAAQWYERLTPRDLARMRHALDQGARNGAVAGPWTELA